MLLQQVKTGKIKKPFMLVIHGPPGVGKSTFGADSPRPIFICGEEGTNHLDVARFPLMTSFADVMKAIGELTTDKHEFKTLVIDSLDWLEPMVWDQVARTHGKRHIEDIPYKQGYIYALQVWQDFTRALSLLRDKTGMNVILICHSHLKAIFDATENKQIDRYTLKLHEKASALFKEFADAILFFTYEVFTKVEGGKVRGFSDGSRVALSSWRPSYEAKNRLGLPDRFPLSWSEFVRAAEVAQPADPENLKQQISSLLDSMEGRDEWKQKVKETMATERYATNATELAKILNKVESVANAPVV